MRKKYPKIDPNAGLEAEKYPNPIASRAFILEIVGAASQAMPLKTLLKKTKTPQSEASIFLRRVRAMVRDGQLLETPSGYAIAETVPWVDGSIQWRRNGECICISDKDNATIQLLGETQDLFPGDRVQVQITRYGADGESAGIVKRHLSRVSPIFVGTYQCDQDQPRVEVFHRGIQAPVLVTSLEGHQPQIQDYVAVEIHRDGERSRQNPKGRVVAILGGPNQPGIETEVACRQFDLPITWPAAVEKEARALGTEVQADPERLDLRDMPFVTIDGEDARDFDDAVYCFADVRGEGCTLLVAIADVSAYVKPQSALDKEAYLRGTSVYFPDRVVPMLPEALSNELCSLKPGVDRWALVCEMKINAKGIVTRYAFYHATIRSHARLTYQQVQAVLDGDERAQEHFSAHHRHLLELEKLYQKLIIQRKARGAIDFDSVETRIDLSDSGEIVGISPVTRLTSHRIIEECMLCANVAAAKLLRRSRLPAMYRVHAAPTADKWRDLRKFLGGLGIKAPKADPTPENVSAFLERIQGRADYRVIQTMVLRSMNQATYSLADIGHFGLAYDSYLHFTSPIRRYPDLVTHRLVSEAIRLKKEMEITEADALAYDKMALHCSYTERRAEEASRDVQFALKCRYMQQHVGETFFGVVVGVTHFGLFVQLENVYIEGLLHVSEFGPDYYAFDEDRARWEGEKTGKIYQLGDKLQVVVARVGVESRKIDLTLVPDAEGQKKLRRHRRGAA